MYLQLYNALFITIIFLLFSPAYAQPKQQCNDLLKNKIKNVLNETNCLPLSFKEKEGSENKSKRHIQSRDEEEKVMTLESFSKDTSDFSIWDISFNSNKEKAIDILKSAVSINENEENKTYHENIGIIKETNASLSVLRNINITENIYNDEVVVAANKSFPANYFSEKREKLDILNISQANNENVINILKAAPSSSSPSEENAVHKQINQNKSLSGEQSEKTTIPYNKSTNKSTNTTESQTTSSEIILSEITNLSRYDGEERPVGQKILFQRSVSDSENNNTAGKEILRNVSGTCGYLLGKRISFAEPTTLMEFPWTALLLYNTNIRYHCGGSLITTKYVLTAAHCVAQEFYELTGVRLGEHDISEPVDCAPDLVGADICATTVDANVVKIIVHHDYSHLSFKNDIALLRLDNEYFGRSFYPICVPSTKIIYSGKSAEVAGWGATEKALRSSLLLKATVPIFDISKCSEIYRYNIFNDTTEICASGANEIDVCKGDSGGAIFYQHNVQGRDKFFQLGIISLGVRGCGDKRFFPAVFTKLNAFYSWIENNLEY